MIVDATLRGEAPVAKPPTTPEMLCMDDSADAQKNDADAPPAPRKMPKEIGGPKGPEPTRYGDWEVKGRCTDF